MKREKRQERRKITKKKNLWFFFFTGKLEGVDFEVTTIISISFNFHFYLEKQSTEEMEKGLYYSSTRVRVKDSPLSAITDYH